MVCEEVLPSCGKNEEGTLGPGKLWATRGPKPSWSCEVGPRRKVQRQIPEGTQDGRLEVGLRAPLASRLALLWNTEARGRLET